MKLGVVIIHYNTSTDLDRCLESLFAYPPADEFEVVVVDNASSDAGLAEVQRRYPDCRWLINTENLGYAKGCNQGLAAVDAEYYLVLNPDIVIQPGALDRLLAYADGNPRAGIVGPQLLNEDGSLQHSCRRFYTFRTLLLRRTFLGRIFPNSETVRRHLMLDFDHLSIRPVDWVLGGCLLARRDAIARVGPMDERFFLYFEDVDWCYRMWQAGYEVCYTPAARFVHRHRRDSAQRKFSRSFWLHLGSLISFYEKWGILVWLLKKWRDPLLMFVLWLLDLTALTTAFWSAYGLRDLMGGIFAEPLYPSSEYVPLLVFSWLLATATFILTGRYRPGGARLGRALGEHLRQVGIVGVLLLASTYLGHQEVISRAVLLMFIPLLAMATGLVSGVFLRLLRRLEKGHFSLERTLLVGAPGALQDWLNRTRDPAAQGIDLAGYVADPETAGVLPPLAEGHVPWLGTRTDLVAVVNRYRISQVVIWGDSPADAGGGDVSWRQLARLRRLRVRLRWQGGGAWLLATGARPELFGDAISAVQGTGSDLAARLFADRLLALAVGGILGLVGLLPALWLRLGSRGVSPWIRVNVGDIWGHELELPLAVGATGKVKPLVWQWRLAGALLRGSLTVFGPRPAAGGRVVEPRSSADVLRFWRSEPQVPGLTGSWATGGQKGLAALGAVLRQLWRDPGGLGTIDAEPGSEQRLPTPVDATAEPEAGGEAP